MAGKARVHELAKELGVTSKQVLEKLKDIGEFVKSPSSTVEAPVARKLREAFPADAAGAASAPARRKTAARPATTAADNGAPDNGAVVTAQDGTA
ncbi:MAG: translation initiation factor IF-2 N-terminal domain-containing protein, partial [Pseudonocardiales bacterium]|nr:translation initiation factor IF-2 N-terminal domain-containing protein [Pseudonocardiales bacterium]